MGQQQSSKLNEPFTFGYYAAEIPPTHETHYSDLILDHDLYKIDNTSHIKDHIDSIYYEEMDDETDTLRDEEGWSRLTASGYKRMNTLLNLSNQSLIKLSSGVACLNNLTKLDLSNNLMISLPRAIGQLFNLCILDVSNNQLEHIPDTINQLKKLQVLNLSKNKLSQLPKGIGQMPQLMVLLLHYNQLVQLPQEMSHLSELLTLDISHNPLKSIPAEIASLKSLKKFLADECLFESDLSYPLSHNPPSLFEICARQVCSLKIPAPPALGEYLKTRKSCSFCSGPFFESFVPRKRLVQRLNTTITLDYRLCTAHWTDEKDRLLVMFSTGAQDVCQPNHQDLSVQDDEEEEDDASCLSLQKDKKLITLIHLNNAHMRQSFAHFGSRLRSGTL